MCKFKRSTNLPSFVGFSCIFLVYLNDDSSLFVIFVVPFNNLNFICMVICMVKSEFLKAFESMSAACAILSCGCSMDCDDELYCVALERKCREFLYLLDHDEES